MGSKLLNRDLQTLMFNQRVAAEGIRSRNTLGTRVEFFGIALSNIREFMEVRYPAILKETPEEIGLARENVEFIYNDICDLFLKFNKKHRLIRKVSELSKDDRKWASEYFKRNVFPTLLTITADKARQPNIHNGLHIMMITKNSEDEESIGYVEIPSCTSRFIRIPKKNFVITIDDLIQNHAKEIFHGHKIIATVPFAISRSAEIYIQANQYTDVDPFQLIQDTLKERENSWITMLEVGSKSYVKKVRKFLQLDEDTLIVSNPLIRLSDLKNMPSEVYTETDKPKRYQPYPTFQTSNIFDYIKQKDRLCFHPFESYDDSVVRFIEDAAIDPNVVSIRICLYRVSDRSRIVDALLKAADSGKLVTALIELKARFDERHNMKIATIMKEGGVRIVYTKPDIKTHAKLCLVTRMEKRGLRIYSHVGTGNYSESNSRLYTDYSYFTADQQIGGDLTRFFNLLTSDQDNFKSRKVIYAPYNLKETVIKEINKQVKRAKAGKFAQITIKCNALTDPGVAERLLDAAKNGVKLKLIVRTSCVIEPQKNIQVFSIVGAFLEHSRVYVFGTGKHATVYIGSADMMTRNLSRRNELLLLVENKDLKSRILKHIKWYLSDTENRWEMRPNSKMRRVSKEKGKAIDCHQLFRKEAKEVSE